MKRIVCAVFFLAWTLLGLSNLAWSQGASGNRQFNQQAQAAYSQVKPLVAQGRQALSNVRGLIPALRQQGINTAALENSIRQAEMAFNSLDTMQWWRGTGSTFQTINPFGDYLFHGVPVRPGEGGLATRHLDPYGLAARAEQWAQELRDVSKGIASRQGEDRQTFIKELNDKLQLAGLDLQHQLQASDLGGTQLKQQRAEDLSLAGLPRLQGDTPMLLRDPFGRDDPTIAPAPDRVGGPDIRVNIDQPVPLLRSEPGPDDIPWRPVPLGWRDQRDVDFATAAAEGQIRFGALENIRQVALYDYINLPGERSMEDALQYNRWLGNFGPDEGIAAYRITPYLLGGHDTFQPGSLLGEIAAIHDAKGAKWDGHYFSRSPGNEGAFNLGPFDPRGWGEAIKDAVPRQAQYVGSRVVNEVEQALGIGTRNP